MKTMTTRPGLTCLALALALVAGCTHLAIEDCGGEVIGKREPRIRSSHFRMLLADLPAASNRFAPFAAMSALAYAEDADCGTTKPKLTPQDRAGFEAFLQAHSWREDKSFEWVPACEDGVGLFFRVWVRDSGTRDVVIAFRGTWGFKDWLYGNLHGLTRFLPMEDQYSRARAGAQRVFDRYPEQGTRPPRFLATGHSLGGGLAQHILYSFPAKVEQAFAFDPSSITGFADQTPENQVAGCDCSAGKLEGEPRIYRVYDEYEILANLRIFHKTFLPPERHIQEVRVPNRSSHSMKGLAEYFMKNANPGAPYSVPWYAGKGNFSAAESCTAAFVRLQKASCDLEVAPDRWNKCPQ